MYQYQKDGFFTQAPGMMEELCEQELIELGATNTKVAYQAEFISIVYKPEILLIQKRCCF